MANVPLKSIKFPGLPDTYTIAAEEAADIADLKSAMDAVEETLPTKADNDGSYQQMTVGNAEQLVSTVGIEDSTPYLLRTTGGAADIGDRVKLSEITGGSVAWNQLINANATKAETTASGLTYSATGDGGVQIGGTTTDIVQIQNIGTAGAVAANHVYYCSLSGYTARTSGDILMLNGWTKTFGYGKISKAAVDAPANSAVTLRFDNNSTIPSGKYYPQLFDLTQMFGSTIADYIYSLETATAGAGVAYFRNLFPKPYYAYDAGSILSVKTTAHREVGFNQFDKSTVVDGKYASASGIDNSNSAMARSDYIRVVPNTRYYTNASAIGMFYTVYFYDADKNYIGSNANDNPGAGPHTFTTPSNAYYAIVNTAKAQTSVDNLVLNISWDGERDGEYEPYEEHSYPLDDVELRGIPKLDANNNLYYDGDTYESDGTVNRKMKEIEVTGCASVSTASTGAKYASLSTDLSITEYTRNNFLSTGYAFRTDAPNDGGKWFRIAGLAMYIFDERFTDKATANSILASEKPRFVYELATPTTEEADPYQETQICNDFGIEEFVDTRTVPIPVGHASMYQSNLRAKLEMAPDSPDGSGDFIVRQTNGTNEYVALSSNETVSGLTTRCPACPTGTDGTFTLKATVSSGSVTYSWESDS